jgi:hypothetical protein
MKFKHVFLAVFIGTALVVAAFLFNRARPDHQVEQPSPEHVKATGKCAECHSRETGAVVHQFESSVHAKEGVTCLDCHQPADKQEKVEHRGFTIGDKVTSKNCSTCHANEYDQYRRSRHAAPAWAAVKGRDAFTEDQLEFAKKYHPEAVDRPANKLAQMEGPGAISKGCGACHSIGRPNPDGSIGTCTECHSAHKASVRLARTPETCGQCHMGPDHAQLEIYKESKHGVLFNSQKEHMNLDADPKELTTKDMPVPTCSTCHMSGIGGRGVTHNVGKRLSWYLFSAVSEKRPHYQRGQDNMQQVCMECHATDRVENFYKEAETVLHTTNKKVEEMQELMEGLREDGLLTPEPFDEKIEFVYFDLWHYYGRTAKHGAFMGGPDFVQWHGNYELLLHKVELEEMAKKIRAEAKDKAENTEKEEEAE